MDLRRWLSGTAGLSGRALESAIRLCDANFIDTVDDLRVLAQTASLEKTFPQSIIAARISAALGANKDFTSDSRPVDTKTEPVHLISNGRESLPKGKRYPFFASHKKSHTRFGDASADLARATKDIIKYKANLEGYFDADNLQNVSIQALSQGIVQSCSVLLFLNDETLDSKWVAHEVEEARAYGIPIICVVDADRQTQREVIDHYMEKGFGWLFAAQVISFTTQNRDACIDLMTTAIRRAVEYCHTHDTLTATATAKTTKTKNTKQQHNATDVHDSDAANFTELDTQLKKAVIAAFSSTRAAFDLHSKHDVIGKKQWKKLIKKAMPSLTPEHSKLLRKQLPTRMSWSDFSTFIGGFGQSSISSGKGEKRIKEGGAEDVPSGMAALPPEVPELPPSFRPRMHAQERLLAALLAHEGAQSTAVTAPKSRVSSQGMGGVGKTMLTAAVVRDERLRASFKTICWLNLSQLPQIIPLQRRLYGQITSKKMPKEANDSVERQIEELRKAAMNRRILVVLDDIWDADHEHPFSCIDPATSSKLLCTTRIKGIMPKGLEVELELLGVKESVELLAAVAEIDADQTPPCCLEIAQLCGRLPLCLNIVGNLIRTFGGGWEDEIPSILKKDMKSLTAGEGAHSNEDQSLNLQQRVIQSGLDSLVGADATDIVILFEGMAVFAEDQIVPVAILSVLWASIDPREHGLLPPMKVRQWVSQLVSRSILLGSSTDGVSMHDIVRDFTIASQAGLALQQRQRSFVTSLVAQYDATATERLKSVEVVKFYVTTHLAFHVSKAFTQPLYQDPIAKQILLHGMEDVVDQSMQGSTVEQLQELAEWYANTASHYWAAARSYDSLAFKSRGLNEETRASYMQAALSALQHVSNAEATKMKAVILTRLSHRAPKQEDRNRAASEMLAWAQDETHKSPAKIRNIAGLTLMGVLAGHRYCLYRDNAREDDNALKRQGALLVIKSSVEFGELAQPLEPGYRKLKLRILTFMNIYSMQTSCSMCTVEWVAASEVILGVVGEKLLEIAQLYSVDKYHRRMLAESSMDYCHLHPGIQCFFFKFADIFNLKVEQSRWEASTAEIAAHGEERQCLVTYGMWPFLELGRRGGFSRATQIWKFSGWGDTETWIGAQMLQLARFSGQIYSDDNGKSAWAFEHNTFVDFLKSLFAIMLPSQVSPAAVAEWIPNSDCRATKDLLNEQFYSGSLSHYFSIIASEIGTHRRAAQHARQQLAISFNTFKQARINAHLGKLLAE